MVVKNASRPMNGLTQAFLGIIPITGKHYFFTRQQMADFIAAEPLSESLFRPFIGADEFLYRKERFILHLDGVAQDMLEQMPLVQERMHAVSKQRKNSKAPSIQKLSAHPTKYGQGPVPTTPFLVIPKTSGEHREYLPMGFCAPPTMASDLVFIVPNATKSLFAILTSAMHMAWMRLTAGRLKSDYRYSINSTYNTFPVPPLAAGDPTLEELGQAVLDARDDRPLAKQYDPQKMTPTLRAAHAEVDAYVDSLYVPEGFTCEADRVVHLLTRYYDMEKR